MLSARLEQAAQYVDWNSPTRLSLLVFRNGRLVFERYFQGCQATDANNIKSVSKSVLSILDGHRDPGRAAAWNGPEAVRVLFRVLPRG